MDRFCGNKAAAGIDASSHRAQDDERVEECRGEDREHELVGAIGEKVAHRAGLSVAEVVASTDIVIENEVPATVSMDAPMIVTIERPRLR